MQHHWIYFGAEVIRSCKDTCEFMFSYWRLAPLERDFATFCTEQLGPRSDGKGGNWIGILEGGKQHLYLVAFTVVLVVHR